MWKGGGSDRHRDDHHNHDHHHDDHDHRDDHHNHDDDDNVQSVWKVVSGVRGRGCTTAAT